MIKTYISHFLIAYMKKTYIIYFFVILTIIVFTTLYMIEIPAPSAIITEKYTLKLK